MPYTRAKVNSYFLETTLRVTSFFLAFFFACPADAPREAIKRLVRPHGSTRHDRRKTELPPKEADCPYHTTPGSPWERNTEEVARAQHANATPTTTDANSDAARALNAAPGPRARIRNCRRSAVELHERARCRAPLCGGGLLEQAALVGAAGAG